MKIGLDARCLMNGNYSGVAWYTYNLYQSIFAADSSNEYVLFYNSSKTVSLPDFKRPNVHYVGLHIPNKLFNLCLNIFNFPKLDRLIGGCDAFFSPNLHFLSYSNKCKKIVAVHDLSFLAYPKFFTIKQRLWHHLILNKKILQQADLIMADSQSTKNDLIDLLGINEAKIKVAYLGVDEKYFVECSTESLTTIKKRYNLPDNYLFFVGTIEPRKNLLSIIGALDNLGWPVDLVIAGSYGWKSKQVKKLIEANKKIHYLGYVDEIDKPALYRLAKGLIYPSYYEGYGLPIVEAMASGCPVVAGNNSSQGEVLGDCGILVDPYNLTSISKGIDTILNKQDLVSSLVDKGRLRAKEFSWGRTAVTTLEQISKLF